MSDSKQDDSSTAAVPTITTTAVVEEAVTPAAEAAEISSKKRTREEEVLQKKLQEDGEDGEDDDNNKQQKTEANQSATNWPATGTTEGAEKFVFLVSYIGTGFSGSQMYAVSIHIAQRVQIFFCIKLLTFFSYY